MRSFIGKVSVLLIVLAMAGTACSKSPTESSSEDGGKITIGSDQANDHGTEDLSGQAEASLELDSFYFEPTIIKGTAGQGIKLELENESDTLHNFSLAEQSIDQDVQAGQKMEVEVKLPESGFVEFFCKYHRATGMAGELTVSS